MGSGRRLGDSGLAVSNITKCVSLIPRATWPSRAQRALTHRSEPNIETFGHTIWPHWPSTSHELLYVTWQVQSVRLYHPARASLTSVVANGSHRSHSVIPDTIVCPRHVTYLTPLHGCSHPKVIPSGLVALCATSNSRTATVCEPISAWLKPSFCAFSGVGNVGVSLPL